MSCACSRRGGRPVGPCRSTAGRSRSARPSPEAFDGVDIALFSAGADVSKELAPAAVARGATVIDNSSAWRMDPPIPLVVSQVNPDDLEGHPGIIANPNCSTMQLAPVLMALRDAVGLERVVVDTYQSVSGTGADAIAELEGQIRAHVAGEAPVATVYPHPIAFNALPEIDVFLDNGYTKEEWKVVTESRKILAPARTCGSRARPSASRSSSATPRRSTSRRAIRSRPERARELFAAVPGRRSSRTTRPTHRYPLATEAAGRDEIFVGRVRRDIVDRRRSRPGLLGRVRQPAQGRRDERGRARRGAPRARLDPARRGARRAADRAGRRDADAEATA